MAFPDYEHGRQHLSAGCRRLPKPLRCSDGAVPAPIRPRFPDPGRHRLDYLLGVGYDAADLERGVQQAAAGIVGPAASVVLLLCFNFDPATGRYSLAVTKLLRIGSALSVLVIGVTLIIAHRRDRAA